MARDREKRSSQSPSELRTIFGRNLRELSEQHRSVAGLCRELGINRTQFNRYLASESFPRPDILHRICEFFGVDARVLLQPVSELSTPADDLMNHPMVADFLGREHTSLTEADMPVGFYRFIRPSFMSAGRLVQGLLQISQKDGHHFIRGYEAREAVASQGLPADSATREFRGVLMAQDDGIAALISRKGGQTSTFTYLTRAASFGGAFWAGYTARTGPESVESQRIVRIVFERLPGNCGAVLHAARTAGLCAVDVVQPFARQLLRLGEDFR